MERASSICVFLFLVSFSRITQQTLSFMFWLCIVFNFNKNQKKNKEINEKRFELLLGAKRQSILLKFEMILFPILTTSKFNEH